MARAIGWTSVLALALAFRLVSWSNVDPADPARHPFDGDCQYHRLRAELIARDYPHVAWRDPDLGGGGFELPWPPLFDEVIATAARLTTGGAPSPEALGRTANWVPVALGISTVPLVGWLAGALVGPELAIGAALFLALSVPHASYSVLGRSDQHVLEVLLHLAVLLAYALGIRARNVRGWLRAVLGLGTVLALAFWNWQGSALNLIFLGVFVSFWHVLSPREEGAAAPFATLAAGCGVGAVALVGTILAFGPSGALWRGTIAGITGLHVLLTAATAVFAAVLWAARRRRAAATRSRRAAELLVAALAPLPLAAILPSAAHGVSLGLLALTNGNRWYASISEFQPMLFSGTQPVSRELSDLLLQYGLTPVLALAGVPAMLDRWRRGDERERSLVLLLATWAGMACALTLARNRFGLYAAAPLAICCWWGIRFARQRWLPGLSRGAFGLAFSAVAIAAALAGPAVYWVRYAFAPPAISAGPLLEWTRAQPDPTGARAVYTRWRWGHHVRALARRPALANPFGTEGGAEAFDESLRVFLSSDEGEVERVLRARHAGYLLIEDPKSDVLSYQEVLPPGARVAEVSSSWRTGRTMVENGRYRALVAYRLHFQDGSEEGLPALGGFRLLRETAPLDRRSSARPAYALFGFVPGAHVIVTGASPGAEITAVTAVRTNTHRDFTWRTSARADASGVAELRVPYATGENGSSTAGPLRVREGGIERVLRIPEDAVVSGGGVPIELPPQQRLSSHRSERARSRGAAR